MAADQTSITIETDLFEHREVKPHFINDCCFGEDFAAWLRPRLADLIPEGFRIEEPIQEDYGWGFRVRRGKESIWVALSYAGDGPTEDPAQWVVSLDHDSGLNVLQRIFQQPDTTALDAVRDRIFSALKSTPGIVVIDE